MHRWDKKEKKSQLFFQMMLDDKKGDQRKMRSQAWMADMILHPFVFCIAPDLYYFSMLISLSFSYLWEYNIRARNICKMKDNPGYLILSINGKL